MILECMSACVVEELLKLHGMINAEKYEQI